MHKSGKKKYFLYYLLLLDKLILIVNIYNKFNSSFYANIILLSIYKDANTHNTI